MKKPDTRTAMDLLIRRIRQALPFEDRAARLCSDDCRICSLKLLDYLEQELEGWEQRLARGERPDFGDLNRLADSGRKVRRALQAGGLLPSTTDTGQEHHPQSETEP